MKPLSFIKPALILLLLTGVNLRPLKAQETKNVNISNFTEVSVSAGIGLYLTQAGSESAKIVAKEGVIDEVVIEKSGNNVHVSWREDRNFMNKFKNRSAKVYISYKTLNNIRASSGSSITTENVLKTDKLEASVSSGASIKAQVECKDLEVRTSSGSTASISGKALNMIISSSSGSNIDALNLLTEYAKVSTSSGANVEVNVSKGLQTSNSSGGNIRYKGNAAVTSKNSGVRHID